MKKLCLFVGLISLPLFADPFHRASRTELPLSELTHFDETGHSGNHCHHSVNVVWSDTALSDIKLVGLLQLGQQEQALFTNGEQVLLLQEGDFFSEEAAQIEQISPLQVKLAVMQTDCATNQFIYLKF